MLKTITSLHQLLATFCVRVIQRFGPRSVNISGQNYVVSKEVFNPKYYFTSQFMANHLNIKSGDDVLDIGTGSGIQAITAGQTARKVVAIDINPEAVRCTKENVIRNGLENKISVLQGDLFSPLSPQLLFDVIIWTPPYFEGKLKSLFDYALYDPEKILAKRFFKDAGNFLKPGGYIQMVYTSLADHELLLKITEDNGWEYSVVSEKTAALETFFIYKLVLKTE